MNPSRLIHWAPQARGSFVSHGVISAADLPAERPESVELANNRPNSPPAARSIQPVSTSTALGSLRRSAEGPVGFSRRSTGSSRRWAPSARLLAGTGPRPSGARPSLDGGSREPGGGEPMWSGHAVPHRPGNSFQTARLRIARSPLHRSAATSQGRALTSRAIPGTMRSRERKGIRRRVRCIGLSSGGSGNAPR